ncbi:Rieske 2Fe-2S domain-containing protein [Patescibacteria group bacterium]|jgi:nitrite reductase/ring-hydroxylating ferredoxin subunit|nr:Rieske 2Fe-2S domain-containing protein [Patescibacteria group bacterium]
MIRKIQVAKTSDMKENRPVSFHFGPIRGIAFKRGGTCKAYVNRCTHMGGPVDFCHTGTLRCGWHGADFDPDSGAAVEGQAPPGSFLKRIDLVEEDGMLFAFMELPEDPFA